LEENEENEENEHLKENIWYLDNLIRIDQLEILI
jgi:hypothetical protein